jgi:translation initiation factor IF-1
VFWSASLEGLNEDLRLPGGEPARWRCSTRLEGPALCGWTPAVNQKEAGLVELDGTVVEALPKGIFRVEVSGGRQVLAHVAGTERLRLVRILPGDRVRLSLAPYDPSRGRIIDQLR